MVELPPDDDMGPAVEMRADSMSLSHRAATETPQRSTARLPELEKPGLKSIRRPALLLDCTLLSEHAMCYCCCLAYSKDTR